MIENKHYVSAGGMVFAMFVSRSGTLGTQTATAIRYMHQDRLGSVAVVTDELGNSVEQFAYDPWGKRRFVNGVADPLDAIVALSTDRGFTLHEHLDEVGVIHMNGRIYDPLIGRFMSADPFIQSPENLQSHNRYAYVLNNPLTLTDPSGYFSLKKLFRAALAIGVGYFTGQWIGNMFAQSAGWTGSAFYSVSTGSALGPVLPGLTPLGSVLAGAGGGFASGAIGSGTLSGAFQGAFSGGLFGGAAHVGAEGSLARIAAHGVAGCIGGAAGGGSCGAGAASAMFGKFATNASGGIESPVARGVIATLSGGVGSVIAGGKFENGAVTAAFGYLFNHCGHGDCWGRPDTLQDHFNRHGPDFTARSPAEYAKLAQDFRESALNNPRAEFRIDNDGTLRIYDRATNTFGSYNENGMTKTFYKPAQGEKYWDASNRTAKWGEKIDTSKPENLTRAGKALRVMRILGRNLE